MCLAVLFRAQLRDVGSPVVQSANEALDLQFAERLADSWLPYAKAQRQFLFHQSLPGPEAVRENRIP